MTNTIKDIKSKNKIKKIYKEYGNGLLVITPLIGFLIFGLIPLILSIFMSFYEIRGYSLDIKNDWSPVGFDNYLYIFKDEAFFKAIRTTFIYALAIPANIILSLLIAFLLSKGLKGSKIFRAIYFLPYVCSVVAITYMWQWLFNTQYGVINEILGLTGENAIDWLGNENTFYFVIIIMNIWGGTGFGIILYSASLTNVNKTLLEQAKIDGANSIQRFKNIILPSISPTTFYLFTISLIGSLQAFAASNIMADGTTGPNDAAVTAVYYIYRNIFSYVNTVGRAAAASWVLSIIIFVVILLNFIASKFWVSYD
ncbi:MAG: sugar ABC transporter permease [Acholeplasmatales bacterium]|jgi:multiple sugar transport system permease protein|nr:sugar ABC transporter permease [Acholeplasmatales bacterium]